MLVFGTRPEAIKMCPRIKQTSSRHQAENKLTSSRGEAEIKQRTSRGDAGM